MVTIRKIASLIYNVIIAKGLVIINISVDLKTQIIGICIQNLWRLIKMLLRLCLWQTIIQKSIKNIWVLDTGCNNHISSDKRAIFWIGWIFLYIDDA
jgi:hypothetical protein